MNEKETYYNKLTQIPHLNLTPFLPKVPLDSFEKDLKQFKEADFLPYQTATKNKEFFDFLARNWHGMCLIDSVKNGKQFMDYYTNTINDDKLEFNFDKNGKAIFSPTTIGEMCPNIIKYCYDIVKSPNRTRLSRLMAGGHFHWHSHKVLSEASQANKKFANGPKGKYKNTVIMHIVLKTNSKCWMGVTNQHPFGGLPFEMFKQHYGLGEIWILNGDYYHNPFNGGDEDRDHIMLYANPLDEKLFPVIKNAIDNFEGKYITEEIVPQRILGNLKLNTETGLSL